MKNKLSESINYYAKHPYEFVLDFFNLKEPTIEKNGWIALSDDEKNQWQKDNKNEVTWQQRDVLVALPKALEEGKGVSIKSGHGCGKTAITSWIIIWAMTCFPFPRVPCTANTQRQLYDVLWSELSKWHKKCTFADMFIWHPTSFNNAKHPQDWYAVARTCRDPEAMQGFHAEHLFFMVEEASGVPAAVLETIEGSQTQEGSMIFMVGNPTQITGGFHDSFNSKRAFYLTFTFNSEESPLVSPKFYRTMSSKYGHDTDFYRVRVLGEFPQAEPDTLIPLNIIEGAIAREIEEAPHEVVEIGVDVARFGDDETSIFSRINWEIKEEINLRKRDTMFVADEVVKVIRKYPNKTVLVNVDDTGVGGGVTDRLNRMVQDGEIRAVIYAVNNGSSAKDKTLYLNLGTEMWFFMKDWLKEGKIPNDNDLIAQLSGRKYKISAGKNIMEPKDMMKKRGLTSPDRADGAILTLRSLVLGLTDRSSHSHAC